MKILSAVAAIILFAAFGAAAETTNDLSEAEIQGRQLTQKILEQQPTENFTNTGVLIVSAVKRPKIISMLKCFVESEETNWTTTYSDNLPGFNGAYTNSYFQVHNFQSSKKSSYHYRVFSMQGGLQVANALPNTNFDELLSAKQLNIPFAFSDFSLCDLGLEFFHWPAQKVLKKEVHRSRGCAVLESTNPDPSTNGYSRVVSWIDEESLGIVEAYAYDANGKLLKDFYPKDFKKVNGQWQVQTLVMENVQTGSRSRLEFDLNRP